jgi:DNA-binding MarR family transcriptional regulator
LPEAAQRHNAEQIRILLGLLESVGRDKAQSQRRLAAELGIALGLLNAYLKRCVRKGLVKMQRAPARRYVYYLTPRGFTEKSRLTIEYLSCSLDFFREAKSDCRETLESARDRGFSRIVLAGRSELAEIAIICALESAIDIIAVMDPDAVRPKFMGVPAVSSFEQIDRPFDAVLVTDVINGLASYARCVAAVGSDRVLLPKLLRLSTNGASSS